MEDEIIIQLFWERSQKALVLTEQKYGNLMHRVASNILRDPRDAEEAVSDAGMKLWNSIPPNRPNNLLSYAVRLSRNAAIDILREQRRQKRDNRNEVLFSELEECLPDTGDPAARLEEQELAALINRYLGTIDSISRKLFVRRYFAMDELSELAKDFGMTRHDVSVRLYRVRQKLRKFLEKEGVAI